MEKDTPDYPTLVAQLEALVQNNLLWVTSLANVAAQLGQELTRINWVGFYLVPSLVDLRLPANELVLGPFQGKVACTSIPFGKGVCGTAAQQDRLLRVDDVHQFPGHIACDSASRSEIVVPLHAGGQVVGVLDIDSPELARFTEADETGLAACARAIEKTF